MMEVGGGEGKAWNQEKLLKFSASRMYLKRTRVLVMFVCIWVWRMMGRRMTVQNEL